MPRLRPLGTIKLTKAQLLKIFTRINPEFVDDFFKFLEKRNLYKTFVIDLELLAKWLGCRKRTLMQTIIDSYKENIDYIVTVGKREGNGPGGYNYKKVMLTVDCFIEVCMQSRTKKAKEVRGYFIIIDKFLTEYTDQIADGIIRDIERTATKLYADDKAGYIYIVRSDKTKPYHIKPGEAEDLIERLRAYNTGRPEDIELLYSIVVQRRHEVEACVKSILNLKRHIKNREVFHIDQETLERVIAGCNALSTTIHDPKFSKKLKGRYYLLFTHDDIFDETPVDKTQKANIRKLLKLMQKNENVTSVERR